jgi:transcriptional regulator with XRE-family HTH domain
MTQGELGRRSHMTERFIRKIEHGTSNPSLETMVLVADALGALQPDLLPSAQRHRAAGIFLSAEDMGRVQDALGVMVAALTPRVRRRPRQ